MVVRRFDVFLIALDPTIGREIRKTRPGNLPVYFDIVIEPEPSVVVLAVGPKDRNAVRIGKKAIEL